MYKKQEKRILVLDDDRAILASLRMLLEAEYESVVTCQSINEAKQCLLEDTFDLLLMDMNYSHGSTDGNEGLQLIGDLKQIYPSLPIVVMTAFGELSLAVQSVKAGAAEFIQKPWSNNRLLLTLENVLKYELQSKELERFKSNVRTTTADVDDDRLGMIGESNALKLVREKIRKIGSTDANVLILGENGTGKELVAKAIHKQSHRSNEAFVKIDLGTIHHQLFESELFGAKKGAYTGLSSDKVGRISMADKGTLFLDELGNLEHPMQSKLLSTLQNREVIRVGDVRPEKVDVRLVSATNLPMQQLLNEEVFRQDLLYRVNTIEIHLPPLRERSDDIELLLEHFMERFQRKYNLGSLRYSSDSLKAAKTYQWPGNVRELEHAVERAVLLCDRGVVRPHDLLSSRRQLITKADLVETSGGLNLEEMEKKLISEALKINTGNMTKAAEDLGITRTALYRRVEKYGL